MALSTLLEAATTLSVDGKTLTAKDLTSAYDATTNLGGYGTPNPARGAVYLVVALFRMVSPDVLQAVKVNPYDGLADSTFTATLDSDGYYDWRLIPVNAGVPTGTIAGGTVYFDPADSRIYKTITADTVVGAVILLDTLSVTPPTSAQIEALLLALASTADDRKVDPVYARYWVRRFRLVYLANTGNCPANGYQEELDDLRTKKEGADANFGMQRYFDAVEVLDLIEKIFAAIPNLTNP